MAYKRQIQMMLTIWQETVHRLLTLAFHGKMKVSTEAQMLVAEYLRVFITGMLLNPVVFGLTLLFMDGFGSQPGVKVCTIAV
jgi:hypothetical protein